MTRRLCLLAAVILVGLYLHWMSRVTGGQFTRDADLNGYYDILGRAFASGRLSLPVEPRPELLALSNPWDPLQNEPYRMHDAVLFKGRYYLYHGAAPAVLLFTPWRLITGRDLPQYFALFLIVFAGFLFWCGALIRVRGVEKTTVLAVLALGIASGTPYLLNRPDIYEIAIGGGYLCVGAGMFFLARRQYLAAGFCFGLAIACRPHLGLVGLIAAIWLYYRDRDWRPALRVLAGMVPVGLAVLAYNYARFGNAFEFGIRYMLAGEANQQRIEWKFANLLPGLYYFLICPPDIDPVFPWIRMVRRFPSPNFAFPAGYFLEFTVGALCLTPAILFVLWSRNIGRMAALAGIAVLVFLMGTGFTTHRYLIDFVPLLLFAGLEAADHIPRRVFATVLALSIFVNLAIALVGPYDGYLEQRPRSYLRLASWMSPISRFRPVANPPIDIAVRIAPEPMPDGIRQPIVSVGNNASRYLLYAEHQAGKLRFISQTSHASQVYGEGYGELTPHLVEFRYRPETRTVAVSVDGEPAVERQIEDGIVTAPSQVRTGENLTFPYLTVPRFIGKFEVIRFQTPR